MIFTMCCSDKAENYSYSIKLLVITDIHVNRYESESSEVELRP